MPSKHPTAIPSYRASKIRMRARSRALNRLAVLHRREFLQLLSEEQYRAETEGWWSDPEGLVFDGPLSAPPEWHHELEAEVA